MLQLKNIFGAGFSDLPYPDTITMGQYLHQVIAPLLKLKKSQDNTIRVHVQTENNVVFDDAVCHKPLQELVRDGSTLFYSLTLESEDACVGNAGATPLDDCPLCLSKLRSGHHTFMCGHTFHHACIQKCFKPEKKTPCPICKTDIRSIDMRCSEWFAAHKKLKK